MQCSSANCSHKADKQCTECERYFCADHVEICDLCEGPVCHDCREAHQSNPLHEEERT